MLTARVFTHSITGKYLCVNVTTKMKESRELRSKINFKARGAIMKETKSEVQINGFFHCKFCGKYASKKFFLFDEGHHKVGIIICKLCGKVTEIGKMVEEEAQSGTLKEHPIGT